MRAFGIHWPGSDGEVLALIAVYADVTVLVVRTLPRRPPGVSRGPEPA